MHNRHVNLNIIR